jgi:sulfate transport system ATP-binding protein
LFVRPYEMVIVAAAEAPFKGTVRRSHGIGPRRRVEIALGPGETMVEVDASRMDSLAVGQFVGLSPRQYRVFANT